MFLNIDPHLEVALRKNSKEISNYWFMRFSDVLSCFNETP